jgi:hypothetical protein
MMEVREALQVLEAGPLLPILQIGFQPELGVPEMPSKKLNFADFHPQARTGLALCPWHLLAVKSSGPSACLSNKNFSNLSV